jgi:protein SCO1/2
MIFLRKKNIDREKLLKRKDAFGNIFLFLFLGGAFMFFLFSLLEFYKSSYCKENFNGFRFAERKKIFHFTEYSGKFLILYFGYTSCPGVCSTMMKKLADAYSLLDKKVQNMVDVVMVGLDPENDTPERMERYVKSFNESFSWKLLPKKELDKVVNALGIEAVVLEDGVIEHSSYAVLIDDKGYAELMFPIELNPYEIASDIEKIVRKNDGGILSDVCVLLNSADFSP